MESLLHAAPAKRTHESPATLNAPAVLLTPVLGFVLFALAVRDSSRAIFICLVWIGLQSAVALSGFYLATRTISPHLLLAIAPPLILIAALFLTVD